MLINDAMWLTFWVSFFDRFPAQPGWGRTQIATLWALMATAVGVAHAVFGNAPRLAGLVARGEIDLYLAMPRPVLLHALVGRMSLSAWGDVAFGVITFAAFARPSALDWALFALLSLSNAGILVGFSVLVGSLGFWLANGEGIADRAYNVLINFSMQPTSVFRGGAKLVLFTVLPAGFLAFVPIEILRERRPSWLAAHLAISCVFIALGALAFARGLRRYESGGLMVARV